MKSEAYSKLTRTCDPNEFTQSELIRINPNYQSQWKLIFPNQVFYPDELELWIQMNPWLIRRTYFKPNESEVLIRMNPNESVAHPKKVSNRMNRKLIRKSL